MYLKNKISLNRKLRVLSRGFLLMYQVLIALAFKGESLTYACILFAPGKTFPLKTRTVLYRLPFTDILQFKS